MKEHSYGWAGKVLGALLVICLLAWLIAAIVSYSRRNNTLSKELTALSAKLQDLQARNAQFKQEAQNYQNQEFIEQQARERFNYQKQGELVVAFVDQHATPSPVASTSSDGFFARTINFFKSLFKR